MVALEVIAMLTVGVFGLAVVLNRDPLPQAIVFAFFGGSLVVLFIVLQPSEAEGFGTSWCTSISPRSGSNPMT